MILVAAVVSGVIFIAAVVAIVLWLIHRARHASAVLRTKLGKLILRLRAGNVSLAKSAVHALNAIQKRFGDFSLDQLTVVLYECGFSAWRAGRVLTSARKTRQGMNTNLSADAMTVGAIEQALWRTQNVETQKSAAISLLLNQESDLSKYSTAISAGLRASEQDLLLHVAVSIPWVNSESQAAVLSHLAQTLPQGGLNHMHLPIPARHLKWTPRTVLETALRWFCEPVVINACLNTSHDMVANTPVSPWADFVSAYPDHTAQVAEMVHRAFSCAIKAQEHKYGPGSSHEGMEDDLYGFTPPVVMAREIKACLSSKVEARLDNQHVSSDRPLHAEGKSTAANEEWMDSFVALAAVEEPPSSNTAKANKIHPARPAEESSHTKIYVGEALDLADDALPDFFQQALVRPVLRVLQAFLLRRVDECLKPVSFLFVELSDVMPSSDSLMFFAAVTATGTSVGAQSSLRCTAKRI